MSCSSRSSTPSLSSDDSDLPSTSYDGSHLSWRKFRQEVLEPHQIRVLDSPPKDRIPASFLQIIEAADRDPARFREQKNTFWNQVTTGRGFGPSPIFPPNLLPPLASDRLSRCMVPSFGSREALPDRGHSQHGPFYELAMPHPTLGCGFSASAFTNRELSVLPQWLQATGTIVHWDTGYLSPGSLIYCPFLTFERAFGNKEHRVETANNQCAIAGSYCVRAFQMLYARAATDMSGQSDAGLPVSFSCTVDNTFALLNLHWIDLSQGQTYCMAPLCQFDLSKDVHFNKFLVWTQAIGDWALAHILPRLKDPLERLSRTTSPVTPAPFYPIHQSSLMPPTKLRLETGSDVNHDELLISSLQTAFGDIPWRLEDGPDSALSSSTASWGSPMVSDATFSNLNYPMVHPPRSSLSMSAPNSSVVARRRIGKVSSSGSPMGMPPTNQHTQDSIWQTRFNHAMGEIKELQAQLQLFQRELKGLQELRNGEMARKSADDMLEVTSQSEETATVDLTPIAPKAQISLSVAVPELQAVIETTKLERLPLLECVTLALSGHLVAQLLPGRRSKMLVYGCLTGLCCFSLIKAKAFGAFDAQGWLRMDRWPSTKTSTSRRT
jgi:hypothetical protein